MILCGTTGMNMDFFLRDNASVSSRLMVGGGSVVSIGVPFVYGARRVSGTNVLRKNGAQIGTDSTALGASTISGGAIGYDNNSIYLTGSTGPIAFGKGTISDADLLTIERLVALNTPNGPTF
jgi:hypothetical protein